MEVRYAELVCSGGPIRVVLIGSGPNLLEVLKVIRHRTGLSLWHGKALLDRLPAPLLEDVTRWTLPRRR